MVKKIFNVILILSLITPNILLACSTFCLIDEQNIIFGRNYDWMVEEGMVIINNRNLEKTAISGDNPVHWISKYGSVTFNQYGREMPTDGINEAGLVVAQMWLDSTEYPVPDERPTIGELQWIQYQLDNYSMVEEVINSNSELRIDTGSVPIHFLVCDSSGTCAVIEFLDGEMIFYTDKTLSYPVLTNSTYRSSIDFYSSRGEVFNNENNLVFYVEGEFDLSLIAYSMIVNKLMDHQEHNPIDFAFEILKKVKYGSFSKWSMVYDIANRKVYYYTSLSENIKYIDLSRINFSSETPVMILDINLNQSGDVTGLFTNYTTEANRNLLEVVYSKTPFLENISSEFIERLSEYPETIKPVK
ncbi:MAG: linear amide C-N hydrolase [bacterium]